MGVKSTAESLLGAERESMGTGTDTAPRPAPRLRRSAWLTRSVGRGGAGGSVDALVDSARTRLAATLAQRSYHAHSGRGAGLCLPAFSQPWSLVNVPVF